MGKKHRELCQKHMWGLFLQQKCTAKHLLANQKYRLASVPCQANNNKECFPMAFPNPPTPLRKPLKTCYKSFWPSAAARAPSTTYSLCPLSIPFPCLLFKAAHSEGPEALDKCTWDSWKLPEQKCKEELDSSFNPGSLGLSWLAELYTQPLRCFVFEQRSPMESWKKQFHRSLFQLLISTSKSRLQPSASTLELDRKKNSFDTED